MPAVATPTVWVFEDQLTPRASALASAPVGAPVFMVESRAYWTRVPFHKKRVAFNVASMRAFADELRAAGRAVHYFPLRPADGPYKDSVAALREHAARFGKVFWVTEPTEHHTRAWLATLGAQVGIDVRVTPNNLFLTNPRRAWYDAFDGERRVMERFYRRTRARLDLLMDGDAPAGGKWNLDHENRSPPDPLLRSPDAPRFEPDARTRTTLADVDAVFPDHPGTLADFDLPVTRADAERAFDAFARDRLPLFGRYEDAMLTTDRQLWHSKVSAPLNAGLLEPLALCQRAEAEYRAGRVPLSAAEGFVRQIVGWREYVRGAYEHLMPRLRDANARGSTQPLPAFFWTGDTDLNCLRHALRAVIDDAWCHHIQRLMVICNFAQLAGVEPRQVNDWFYALYVDSWDWVVTPNVMGMALSADGGAIATKPYACTAAYIDRMSDACAGCRYDPKRRVGAGACPFNFLFWTFVKRFRGEFARNPRVGALLAHADRIPPTEMREMMLQRKAFIELTVNGAARC